MFEFKFAKNFNFDNLLDKTLKLAIYSYYHILKENNILLMKWTMIVKIYIVAI